MKIAKTPPVLAVAMAVSRYQLYGDGKSVPYYWVWIPTGATPPTPPAPPRVP